MLNQKIIFSTMIIFLASLFILIGCGNEDSQTATSFTITLDISNVTANSVGLSITANFNGSAPLWKNGYYYDNVKFQSGIANTHIDHDVVPGTEYCYQVGGYVILLGDIWSNVECITPS